MATSFKTRKALGKRYAKDPALQLEQDKLRYQYSLAPGRESLALSKQQSAQQKAQYDQSLTFSKQQAAQQNAQYQQSLAAQKEAQDAQAVSGMVGTVANLGMTAGMMNTMRGKPFFSNPFSSATKTTAAIPATAPKTLAPSPISTVGPTQLAPAMVDAGMGAGGLSAGATSAGFGGDMAGYSLGNAGTPFVQPASTGLEGYTLGNSVANIEGMSTPAAAAGQGGSFGVGSMAPIAAYYGAAKLGGSVLRNNFDDSTVAGQVGESLNRPLNVEQYWAEELGAPEAVQTVLDVLNPLSVVENVISDVLGTWLCTKTKDLVGFTDMEWKSIAIFREFARGEHPDWLEWYVSIGPGLLESIGGGKEYYENLKETFLLPIIGLTNGGFLEAAFKAYRAVVIDLVERYDSALMETAPEVI